MKLKSIEIAIINCLLSDKDVGLIKNSVDFDQIKVVSRDFTGPGFLTELRSNQKLKLFSDGVSKRWGKVGARLNSPGIETGYLLYIDNGYLTSIEGYTYGENWPDEIYEFEIYDV